MNVDAYSLENSYVNVGGEVPKVVDEFAKKWVGDNYLIAFAIMVLLVIIVVWLLIAKFSSEKFNPTQTMMKAGMRDDTGATGSNDPNNYRLSDIWSSANEHLDAAPTARAGSYFATEVQDANGNKVLVVDPNAKVNQPGSAAWNVLNSPDFDCNNRKPIGDDAWSWMSSTAKENFMGDDKLSKIAAGH